MSDKTSQFANTGDSRGASAAAPPNSKPGAPLWIAVYRVVRCKTKYGPRVRVTGLRWHIPDNTIPREQFRGWEEFAAWCDPAVVHEGVVPPCIVRVDLEAFTFDKPPRISAVSWVAPWDLPSSLSAAIEGKSIASAVKSA